MTKRNALGASEFTVRLEKSHQRIWGAFVQAMGETGASYPRAARSVRVSVNTITNWVKGKTDVNVKRVIASSLLSGPFLQKLCVHEHSAPYVARKRRPRSA